jgi:hypothetical protein
VGHKQRRKQVGHKQHQKHKPVAQKPVVKVVAENLNFNSSFF